MKFEVVNDKGVTVMCTEMLSCVPDEDTLSYMNRAGYKFKYNGKIITLKKAKELIKGE